MRKAIKMLTHKSKSELAYEAIKNSIIKAQWKPGEKKSFSQLSALLDVSRTPVVDACKQLEIEGLVKVRPQVGVEATILSKNEAGEIFKIRGVLEGLAGVEASQNLTKENFKVLENLIEEMDACSAESDYDRFGNLNRRFHKLIYNASKMELLIKLLDRFWDNGNRYATFFQYLPEIVKRSIKNHREIVQALRAREESFIRLTLEKDSIGFGRALADYLGKNGDIVRKDVGRKEVIDKDERGLSK